MGFELCPTRFTMYQWRVCGLAAADFLYSLAC